jgi:hypothetical protein
MPLKYKFDLSETYEGHALRRISEIMNGVRCVYCLGPVTSKSPKMRIGKLAACSHACARDARGCMIIGGPYDNSREYPKAYVIEKPGALE